MKRAILTGGTGFVGANLVRRLLRDGHEVHLLVRPGHDPWRIETIQADVRIHEVAFGDVDSLAAVIAAIRPEWVFHLAAYGAYSWQTDARRIYETNLIATSDLLGVCLRVGFGAFVNAGSSSEYGFKDHPPAEDELPEPNSVYAVAKLAATLHCSFVAQSQGVNIRTLRLYSAYGAYEEPARLLPTVIIHGLRGSLPPLVNPAIARDYVHIDDVCEAFVLAAEDRRAEAGAIFNVGTGIQTTLAEVIAAAKDLMSIHEDPQWGSMADRRWDTSVWVADPRRIRTELGWQPHFSFRDGFRQMIEWLRSDSEMRAFYEAHLAQPK